MANISQIKLPNNTVYNIKDKISGYTTNTGTVTSVAVSGGTGISVSGSPITTSGTITVTNTGVTGVKGNSESSYRTGQVNLTAANIGAAAASHTHTINEISQSQSATSGGLDPLTQTMIGSAASNKSFHLPASAITIEYSTNGGSTWIDYGATDTQKVALFSETRSFWALLGKNSASGSSNTTNNWLRITIEPTDRYVSFNGLYIWMSTQGNTVTVDLERSTIGAKNTFTTVFTGQSISGWSGNNIRYFSYGSFGGGSTQTSNNYKYRLIFKQTAVNTNYGSAQINDIRFLGLNVWSSPNSMVSKNHLYTWDENLNAVFPAKITTTELDAPNVILYGGVDTGLGANSPASNAKEYFLNAAKVPKNSIKMFLNSSGQEYALLFSNRTDNYGTILKWGYQTKYMYILRKYGSTWKSDDWEKIDAGNSDTVNGYTVNSDVPSGAKFTDTVTTATTTGSGNAVTAITASNGALTVTKGTTFLTSHQDISGKADKSATVSTITWDSTNNKLTKTINGSTTDVVTLATIKTALGSMPASDVSSWAKASSKPSYAFSELTTHPTSISGYGITDAYTKTEVDNKVSAVLRYKGVKAAISNLPTSGNITGDVWHVTATSGEYAWDGTEWQELGTAISIPANTGSSTTGISIANHSTGSVIGVSSSTTSVYGVSSTTTTASKVTLGTAKSIPNVTSAGSASTWTFESKSIPNVTAAGSASTWTFESKTVMTDLTMTINGTDSGQLDIAKSTTTIYSKSGGGNGTAPTLGTAITVYSKSGGGNGTAPTLGTAISVPNVTEVTDVTVPIKNADATTVPIKNTSATTVVTSATHSVTDNGHTHTI